MDEAGGKEPVLVSCSWGGMGRQVNCGRAGVPYMEENRKEAVTFLLQTYGGARRGRKDACLLPSLQGGSQKGCINTTFQRRNNGAFGDGGWCNLLKEK